MKNTLNNLFMAIALVITLIGGIYMVAGIIAINNMNIETPAWENIQLP